MKHIEDKDLEFLQFIKSEDLNKLVDILTNPSTEELTKRDIYKEFQPDHSQYWEEIATELQHFGGNTLANIVRVRRGVLYAEILRDVCKALKVNFNTYLSTEEIEDILLSSISDSTKEDGLLKRMGRQVDFRNKDMFLLAVPVLPITIPSFLLKKVSDPAYRVTVEAVFEIIKLRKQYQLDSKNKNSEELNKNLVPLKYSESFSIVDNNGKELTQLKTVEEESINNINFIKANGREVDKVKQLLADTFKGIISTPNQTIELVFSPEVQEGLKNGTLALKEGSAVARQASNGQIKEFGKIVSSGQGKQLLTGGYQLLSIAVAQSHLADIEKSLGSIKRLVNQIIDKLEAEDKAQIEGSIDYIETIVDFIRENEYDIELSQQKKNKIEDIICDILKWEKKLLQEFKNLNNEINTINDKDTFGTKNTFDELRSILKRVEPLRDRYELILKLSSLLNIIKRLIDSKEVEFSNVKIKLSQFENEMNQYNKNIEKQKEKLKSYFNLDETLEERKKIVDKLQNNNNENFKQLTFEYEERDKSIEDYFNKNNNAQSSIILSFDENNSIEKYAINLNACIIKPKK